PERSYSSLPWACFAQLTCLSLQQRLHLTDQIERAGHADETVGRCDCDGAAHGLGGRRGEFERVSLCVWGGDAFERVERGGAWIGWWCQDHMRADGTERGDDLIKLFVAHRAEDERDRHVD